jgi:ribulose-phosphate 3-epimerase
MNGRSATPDMAIELAPSILSANFARLGEEAKAALDGGGTVLHVDVMDGHFVPNITIGPLVVASLRKALPNAILDCHLMIENPDKYVPAFAEAGASWISVHQEACVHLHRTLQLIESHGCKSGVVLNPATPVHMLDEVLDMVHHVLIMSVNPGFGAQKFIPGGLHKIKTLVEVRESLGLTFRIEIDGGVSLDTVGEIVRAGAELLVAGNAVFSKGDIRENAKKLLEAARAATYTRA